MIAESTGSRGFIHWRLRFRGWRGTRPFWAGFYTLLGGLPIAYFPYAQLHFGDLTLAMSTTAGAGSLIIGVLLVTLGLTMWFHSIVRVFAGVAAILLGLVSIPVSNIGGFGLGLLFSVIGGALALSWMPGRPVGPTAPEDSTSDDDGTPQEAVPYDDTPHDAPVPQGTGNPSPSGPDDGEDPNATDATAHADSGRNSAG
jgi:hypothetical protein